MRTTILTRVALAAALVVLVLPALPAQGAPARDGGETATAWTLAADAWNGLVRQVGRVLGASGTDGGADGGTGGGPDTGGELGPMPDPNGLTGTSPDPGTELGPMPDPNG